MYAYESKALVDTANFPSLKIYPAEKIEFTKPNGDVYNGVAIEKAGGFEFILDNDIHLNVIKLDSTGSLLRIYHMTALETEAKWGDFKIVK